MKVEIKLNLQLTDEKISLLMAHSFYNIMNVLITDFQLLGKIINSSETTQKSLDACHKLVNAFDNREKTLLEIQNSEQYLSIFRSDMDGVVEKVLANSSFSPENRKFVDDSLKNIENILHVFSIRVREAIAWRQAKSEWIFILFEEIRDNLRGFLDAATKNASDRFGVAYSPSEQTEKDYFVDMQFHSHNGENAAILPFLIQDTFRDLVANARKYTPVGGKISATLDVDEKSIKLEVSDTGRGIPEGEIEKAVDYGFRGSNTLPEETKGGGFGLTKAYYFCKSLGGRMWIDSELGKGTAISMVIPRPPETGNSQ